VSFPGSIIPPPPPRLKFYSLNTPAAISRPRLQRIATFVPAKNNTPPPSSLPHPHPVSAARSLLLANYFQLLGKPSSSAARAPSPPRCSLSLSASLSLSLSLSLAPRESATTPAETASPLQPGPSLSHHAATNRSGNVYSGLLRSVPKDFWVLPAPCNLEVNDILRGGPARFLRVECARCRSPFFPACCIFRACSTVHVESPIIRMQTRYENRYKELGIGKRMERMG